MSYMKYALILTASSLMIGCVAAAPQLTASEEETKSELSASQYQPAPREIRDNIDTQQILAQAAFWSHEYNLNPSDLEAAIKFSTTLRKMGNPSRAIEVTRTTRALYPRDPYLNAEHAAALIADQQTKPALKIIDMALRDAPAYGRLWSLKGVALDQMEKYAEARPFYNRALQITPNDPNIMANMGLNFALSGDPHTAHQWLSRATAHPDASESVHANLELVKGYMAQVTPQSTPQPTPYANRQPSAPAYTSPSQHRQSQHPQAQQRQVQHYQNQVAAAPKHAARQPNYAPAPNYVPRSTALQTQQRPQTQQIPQAQYRPQAQQHEQRPLQYKQAPAAQAQVPIPTSQNVLSRIARNVGPKAAAAPNYAQRPTPSASYGKPPHGPASTPQDQTAQTQYVPQLRGGYPAQQTPYYDNAPQQQQQQPIQPRGASRQR
ncbi:MAG: tetratricopeptide repeat protein [Maricaulaceae bacterium]